jgi:superfamily II DNA or RNA helicase
MHKLPTAISAGQRVDARGESWLLVQRDAFDDCTLVTLRGAGDDNRGHIARLLTPFDRLRSTHVSNRVTRAARRTVLRAAARAVARAHGWLEAWSAVTANIDLLPWQIEPAMAAVSGATRLLLTDDVGLGKTIQAGLILAELRARGLIVRALILTPASLRDQWAAELHDRFGLAARVFDHPELTRLAAHLPVGVNPWATADLVISSIDLVKRPEIRSALDAVPFDLLVVDEAHHLTPGTDRGSVVADLAGRIPWVVLATATPHSGDEEAFTFLSGVGAHSGATAPVVFRRSAHDVGQPRSRRVHFHRVEPTREERRMLDETLAYATMLWQHRDDSVQHGAFVGSVICRRAVSSSRALALTLARRRQLLTSEAPEVQDHPELPWLEEEDADGVGADRVLAAGPLPDIHSERAQLDRIIALAERVSSSSKFDAIDRVLTRVTEPAIIFSEYRDTLCELEERLSGRIEVATLHGGLSSRERRESILRFLEGKARVLLATDAAGEGLNLQARCRLIVNVELPWNPVRLAQRIGRVDRLGQRRRVHAIHLYHRDSYEDRVLARLQRRMAAAARDLGRPQFDEAAVAAAVFDEMPIVVRAAPARQHEERARVAANETAHLRRTAARLAVHGRLPLRDTAAALCVGLPRAKPVASGMALLYEWDVHDAEGRLVSREVACVVVAFDRARRTRRADMCRWTRELADCFLVQQQYSCLRSERLLRTAADARATAMALDGRLASIDNALRASHSQPFQGSLFDRRAEQRAKATRTARELARAHIAHQQSSIQALRTLSSAQPARLIAAWAIPVK